MTRRFPFTLLLSGLLLAAASTSLSQTTRAQLEVSDTFFTLAAALNSCGYDAGLEESLLLRKAVRAEVEAMTQTSPQAAQARDSFCQFWKDHQPAGTPGDVTQYTSLALELGPPPLFALSVPEADLPPDAAHVVGVVPLLQKFYEAAAIGALWEKHRREYESLRLQFHDPLAEVIADTDRYLKLPFNNSPGRRFAVYVEPLLAPSRVDSRNYGDNYLVVESPGKDGQLKLAEVRHTYLHFVLDPLAMGHGISLKRLEPILMDIKNAPLSASFRGDISLLVNESLIRAIEARTAVPKTNERAREAYVQHSMEEGFVLTHYFYEALANFEKESTGMKDAYGDLLYNIELERERKRARQLVFAAQATPEVIQASNASSAPSPSDTEQKLATAEQQLATGDTAGARKLAEQVLQHNDGGDQPGHAVFILARIATLSGNMAEARADFQQAVESVHDPRVLAWSHIYLGRIFDIQENREAALAEYRAALVAGDPQPDTKVAAEKGLAAPYQPQHPR